MNIFLLQDLDDSNIDAVIITTATKEEIQESISRARAVEDYTWEVLLENMPSNTIVLDCFNKNNRVYY